MSLQTADVLDAARDLLDRDGWRQGARGKQRGRCALVAIAQADRDLDGPCRFGDAVNAFWSVIGPDRTITLWNDTPGRRVSEVLDAFTAAAARERGTA
jgi:hypothetical protein